MNTEEFRKYGKEVVDYICEYTSNIAEKPVLGNIKEGFLKDKIPATAPVQGESVEKILEDFDNIIMPGVLHWNHPGFHAYFPSGNSYPTILADMLISSLGSLSFTWASSPASTELENAMMEWYAKILDLPTFFMRSGLNSKGGGILQCSASDCVLVCLIAARARTIRELMTKHHEKKHESHYLPQLVAYTSRDAHSCVEKACKMAIIKLRILDIDGHGCLRGRALRERIEKDVRKGLKPCFLSATLGTTSAGAFDNIKELGEVCRSYKSLWFHVDAAYGGNFFILPELRKFKDGLELADSFNTNPNKSLLTSFDCSALWVKDLLLLSSALVINPLYLQHDHEYEDHRHYSIQLSRRFRSLKLWFVFRSYGISGMQNYLRNHIKCAKKFENLVRSDPRFEIRNDVYLGLVCFRLQEPDSVNRTYLSRINETRKYHLIPSMVLGKFIIRMCVDYEHQTEEDMDKLWKFLLEIAEKLLEELKMSDPSSSELKTSISDIPLEKQLSSKFAFTRSVSKEVYEKGTSTLALTDGATPIWIPK